MFQFYVKKGKNLKILFFFFFIYLGYCGMQVSESNPGGTPDSFLITESIGAGTAITTSLVYTHY